MLDHRLFACIFDRFSFSLFFISVHYGWFFNFFFLFLFFSSFTVTGHAKAKEVKPGGAGGASSTFT